MNHYLIPGDKASYFLSLAIRIIGLASPMMYFFLSGGLLMEREESIKDVLKKRVLKYTIILIVFKIIQLIYLLSRNPEYAANEAYSLHPVRTIFGILYSQEVIAQYWFLHSYLAFLILLPVLRVLAKNMQDKHYMYLILLFIIYEIVLFIFEFVFEFERIHLDFPIFETIIIYPLLGNFFIRRLKDKVNDIKFLISLNAVGLLLFAFDVYYTHSNYINTGSADIMHGITPVCVIVLYCDLKFLCDKIKLGEKKIAAFISFCAAGSIVTYLFDPQLHDLTVKVYDKTYMWIKWLPAGILWCLCALTIGIIVAWILRKIPYVGKLFGAK